MAHAMTASDRMYSVRIAPWHLGQGTNVEVLDAAPEKRADRLRLSGQDWIVRESEVYRRREGEFGVTYPKLPGWKILDRSDTGDILHVTKESYKAVQNVVGHELFEALAKGASLDDGTGGTVKSGAVCYLSARIDEPVFVNGDTSPVFPYIVVTWTHDGSGAVKARKTSVRVVCWNTVSASEAEAARTGREFTFRHTKSILDRIDEAKKVLAGARDETKAFVELSNELAALSISDDQRELFVQTFIPEPEADVVSDRVRDNIARERLKVRKIFDSETIPEMHRNTAYGLVQAGVEYLDHLRAYRSSDTYLGRTLLRDEPYKAKLVKTVRELVTV